MNVNFVKNVIITLLSVIIIILLSFMVSFKGYVDEEVSDLKSKIEMLVEADLAQLETNGDLARLFKEGK